MASRIRTLNFLPEVFQTTTNSQFLGATLDQIVQQPEIKRIEGYVGSKFGYGVNAKNYYVTEPTKTRTDYQLDPGVVFTKTNESVAKDFISYPGMLDALNLEGGLTQDNNRLFTSQLYSWDSFTNLDKIINFNQYYWIPQGPASVVVSSETVFSANDYNVFDLPSGYNIVPVTASTSSGTTNPTLTLLRGGTYTFAVNQNTQFWIQGKPGVTGYDPAQPNVQTRDVLGVDNNGASQGIVTFTVPPKDGQDNYNFPGNNLVDVVSTLPFANINGARLADIVGIDGVTSLDGLTVMFYNTGIPNEVGYVSNFFDYTPFDQNDSLTALETITVTATTASTDAITCSSTANLVIGNAIIFNGNPFGGLAAYSTTLPNTIYYVESVINSTQFTVSTTPNGSVYPLSDGAGTMTAVANQGLYEQGYYTTISENFYTIQYLGDPADPVLRLKQANEIPTNQKITATFGTEWIARSFYKNPSGIVLLIPYLSAQLDTLYYQDGTSADKVGVIRLIESNILNTLDVERDILGQQQYTATNGVVFTNGLKVTFQGDVFPSSYLTGEYYVEGVGTAIELRPVEDFIAPEAFTASTYIPWDTVGWDSANWEGDSYIPVIPDYITISRNSMDQNAWSRSNRWFHIDVINATATYNNNPDLITLYATSAYKAKRPIIEFYPNIKMFNSGSEGKAPVDFIDVRTTDAFTLVAGQENYYPDVEVYTAYTGTIVDTVTPVNTATITVPASDVLSAPGVVGAFTVGQYITDSANLLPRNAQISSISGTTTLTIEVSWLDGASKYLPTTTNVSFIATDTTSDNYALFDGAKVIFTADTNVNVRNKVYVSRFSTITGSSTPVITLTEAKDGDVFADQQTVALRGYANNGKEFWFDGSLWIKGQQKTELNQPPLFDVFDKNDVSFGDASLYIGTSFTGCKLFGYGIGTGLDDTVLGFPIRYSSIDNVGDISFDVSLNSDTFDYVSGTNPITQNVNTGYVFQYGTRELFTRQLGWQTSVSPSVQYQLFSFNYDPLNPTTEFVCDVSKSSSTSTNWPTVEVAINNVIVPHSEFTVTVSPNSTTVVLNTSPVIETVVQISLLSDQVSPTAFYSIPTNLNNNPLNADITTANVGDIRGQYQSAFYNNPNTTGNVFGPNNYRDLGNMVPWGDKIIQNSASLVLPGAFLRKQEHNLFNALLFNDREYIKFKNQLVYTVQNSDYTQRYNPSVMLDDALDQITATKDNSQPFFWSDMLPGKSAYITNTYSFANSLDVSIYPLSRVYDFTTANYYGVLVYLTRTTNGITTTQQLIKNQDYTISETAPSLTVTTDLLPGDVVTIKEYNQTYGSYVPNTPTKLGLYPAYIPEVILDENYNEPTYFIKGHDGSYNKLYGDYDPTTGILVDFRDQVLLEFELRVYNNLKISSVIPIKAYEVLPGFFRDIDYSYADWLYIYSPNFLSWAGQNRLNYKTQYYNSANNFTYNYTQSGNAIDNSPISQGYWRGIYQYFYDTTTPNTTPWQMLGFTEMPTWWTSRYGSAPYTNDNLVLWSDLAQGIDWNNGDPIVIPEAVRDGLLEIIPVNSAGELLPPMEALVGSYNQKLFQRDWKVGDGAPVEFSYRRSSSYPFDLMKIMALMKPAEFFNLGVDLDNYKYNAEFNQYLVNDRSHLRINEIEIYGNGTAKTSYINWIVDYEKQVGIDATTNITEMLDNMDVRLVYRLAGFSDKTLLKFYVEKSTANSNNSSLLIPDESYQVLLYDNQAFNRISYSGVVIQIATNGGFTIFGNSQTVAYFKTLKPKFGGIYTSIDVEQLSVRIAPEHLDQIQLVPYNTTFYTVQEVSQFLSDYGAYLTSLGMKFQDLENELEINWNQMIAEFLYWAQTGWSAGSIVTLNPSAKSLVINKDSNIVQPLTLQQSNFVLNQNLYPIQLNELAVVRQETEFRVTALNQGDVMSYGQFNLSNFEHGIVFNNETLFGDVLYNLTTGLRQTRITVRGAKSANWNGTVDAAGFIYNQSNVKEWSRTAKYTKGEIVTFKNKYWVATKVIQPSETFKEADWKRTNYDEIQTGLLPNASTRSYESTLYYDINQANLEKDADLLSFSLIGYRPRDYMALADLTDITQVNVYKNMIKNKGTLNAASAFRGANLPQGGIDYDIYENWAIKAGEFGGVLNNNFVEFKINQNYMTGNPSIVGLTNGVFNVGVQQEVPLYSLFNYGRPITNVDVLPTTSAAEPSTVYPDAGYVNFNDVKMSAFYYAQMPNAINKSGVVIPIQDFYVRDYVWLANYLETWQVYTTASIGQITNAKNNLNDTVTITFKTPHNLIQYQPFSIVNFDVAIDGYYLATIVIDQYRVLVSKTLDPSIKNITGQGIGLKFTSQRVATPSEINTLPLLDSEFRKNTVWVDTSTDGSWGVYRKSINYQLENQITKTSSESLGSAVAIGDALGYLIGDADAGMVYRYTYNDLVNEYQILQTLTGDTSFGSTIEYSGNLYAIAETTGSTRSVKLYQLLQTTTSDDLILIQTLAYPVGATTWGTSITISGDQNWIYISDIDQNTVHVYTRSNIPTTAGYFVIGQTYTIQSIGTTNFTTVGAASNDVGVSFIATGVGSGTGVANKTTYINITSIDGDALGLTTAGDNFGYSIATDFYGDEIVIGTPNQNNGTVDNWGYTYTFQRLSQNVEIRYSSTSPASQTLQLAWTPTTVSRTVSSTDSTGNKVTLDSVSGITVNDPIIFTGTMTGTNVSVNLVYYVATINVPSSYITLKTSRESASTVSVTTNGSVTGATATVQTQPLIVSKNGTVVTDNNYAVVSDSLIYAGSLNAGDIVNISGHEIVLLQTLTTEEAPQTGSQFGISVDVNTNASEIIIGAPFQLDSQAHEGTVYRYTDPGAKYGTYLGTTNCNVTTTRKLLINGYLTFLPAGNAEVVANAIKSAGITNVTAASVDGKLAIYLLNYDITTYDEKLYLGVVDTATLSELGLTVFTKTQEILCPHKTGPTQFGSKVKFNQYGSFVASAPTGTRYSATTFDFLDNENQDDDTIFDNNATQWVDESPNFGAVYMFDYIDQYNESLSTPGEFIYAQSVNSPNLVYSAYNSYDQATDVTYNNQPYYGTALDFNDYSVAIGTPNDTGATSGTTYAGSVTTYNNLTGVKDWSLYRYSAPIVDIEKIYNIQLFSAETNNTLINMDYIDPLQGKILGAARENIDVVSNADPAIYNNSSVVTGGITWGAAQLGTVWLNTRSMRYVNYHQNDDVSYNSQYWATLFPGSDVAIYSWVASTVLPGEYRGPGTPFNVNSYSVQYVISAAGALTPTYYFWARNTNTIFSDNGKTLADSVVASYIESPKASGVSYFAPLLPSVYGLYNSGDYINANDSVLHIGFATGSNDDPAHSQFNLIRDGYASDFLPGVPLVTNETPESLYDRLLDSLCGVDESGSVVPNPYLPRAVQTGILARPRQSFFLNRFLALKNYLQYANTVLAQFPITEIRYSSFLTSSGEFYDTANYWQYINWWATGYNNNTKASLQVPVYADLSTLSVSVGTIVTVATNGSGKSETYVYESTGNWRRIGLENGTIEFKSSLWDYASVRLGYGDNFFDTDTYDVYPSEETRKIVRALNEQLYTNDLLIYRNKSLILLFQYIQAESTENQNYLPWLNKTSFLDVAHTIRELKPIEVFQSDNQDFLAGYLNEIKPYHVVIKEFLFKYTGAELYAGDITDFDLPAKYNSSIGQFVTPELVYANPNGVNQFTPDDPIWQESEYSQWFENYGVALTGQDNVQITTLASYLSLNTNAFAVDNAQGLPINGVIQIGVEQIGYATVDRALNVLSGLTRGVNGTSVTTHIPGDLIYIDLPAVLVLDGGRGYTEPPKVTAYIDTTIYPAPTKAAVLNAVMNLDSVLRIDVIDPGQGYAVLPSIVIDSAVVVSFGSNSVSTLTNTIQVYAPLLQTGDLVQYKVGADSTTVGGLEDGQWYYVNVLETVPSVSVGLYEKYSDAVKNQNRLPLYTTGTGSNHSFNVGAKASAISTALPVRENNITLRFDRTSYNSDIIEWIAGRYYGAFYAGSYHNSGSVASSSITLENTQPPIASILASAQGVAFEITDVRNDRIVTYSSFVRNVGSVIGSTDAVRLALQDDGSGNPNASGGTIGFYIGMPVKFVGAVGSSGIVNEQVYYVNSILSQTDFTISSDPSGSPVTNLSNYTVSVAGLSCYVGQVSDTAVITVNYPGILDITATTEVTNKVTVPLNPTGTGGTEGFYINLPIFFTGTDTSLPNNGVFGGIVENQIYYITTVVDNQTFTMSETKDPLTFDVLSTDGSTDVVVINGDTQKIAVNEPIIFNNMIVSGSSVTSFGGITSGVTYYVSSIVSTTSFQISATVNGAVLNLTTVAEADDTSMLVTSQKNTTTLTTTTGNTMVVNVSLPVSPGQVNGQYFTLYETSGQYPGLTGTDSDLITRGVAGLIDESGSATNAGDFIIGEAYNITAVGSTNFIEIGASSNTVGVTFVATGVGSGTGTATLAGKVVLSNFNPGDTVALWLTNIYNNLPLQISTTYGSSFLTAGTQYYVVANGIVQVEVTATTAGNYLICESTASLFADMPITFSGAGIGGVQIDVEYWVKNVHDATQFTITNTPGGLEIDLLAGSGLMTGTGLPYVSVGTSAGGTAVSPGATQQNATFTIPSSTITVAEAPATGTKVFFRTTGALPGGVSENTEYFVTNTGSTTFTISLTSGGSPITTSGTQSGIQKMIIATDATMDQTPLSTPEFDVSYILGGYRVIINDQASGYAVDNVITILGTGMGGTSPANDLTLTVNAIDSVGAITSVICSGTVPGTSQQYYLKVVSPTEFALYENQLMTVPASGLNLPFIGTTQATVTAVNSSNDRLTIDDTTVFDVNDAVVFTGSVQTAITNITEGATYYIYDIPSSTQFRISTVPGDVTTIVNMVTTIVVDFTMAKSGSFALLPEPFIFNQSLVKYNNRVYVCVISNNDQEFVFGKWELLDSGDRRLNAMDRVKGYYAPTDNMPGVDLAQLFEGVTYPNSTYLGNAFEPALQYPLDTILQDQAFYPTEIDVTAIAWDGTSYIAPVDTPDYSGVIASAAGNTWEIKKLANTPLGTTDIIYAGGLYILTTNNQATPLFRSTDGVIWTTNGYFTPWGSTPYDDTNYDMTALEVASLYLNSIGYRNNAWVAVGQNIVYSTDTYRWYERFAFANPLLSNTLYGVAGINITSFTGFIAVGKGQEFNYSGPITTTVDINLIVTSIDGITWTQLPAVSSKGMYAIACSATNAVAVGEDGIIYISNNGANWLGVNEVSITSTNTVTNSLSVSSTGGFTVGDIVRFSQSFNVFATATNYYVVNIISGTQLQLSTSSGGSPVTVTSVGPSSTTYMYSYPTTGSLRDISYANGTFIAVGDTGLIRTSSDGITWTTRTSGITENLNGIIYNADDATWVVVGDNNAILTSVNNGTTWVSSSVFAPQTTTYDVQGATFEYGYGPEELVPGVVTDNIMMTVATRPGTDWDATVYAHVGYNVVSVEYNPTSGSQTAYSFDIGNLYSVQTPAQIAVYQIDGTTGLGTALYETLDYTIDWVNFVVSLNSPLPFLPVSDKLRVDVYEVGNGNQLVKASTKTDPIRTNTTTGWNEIYVNCNYTGQLYNGSGVIRPETFPVDVLATATDATSNAITCASVKDFVLNDPIRFQGNVFGGLQEDTPYYVKTISYITNRITVSTTINAGTGTAGPTVALTTATGSMNIIIKVGYGAPWTDPIIYHNGSKLLIGTTSTVTRTKASNNAVTTNTTDGMVVGEPIVFSDSMFGNVLLPQTTYYVSGIYDNNEFTVSATLSGPVITLTDATGGAEFITNDYAFGIADNGISASIIFSTGDYNTDDDYITYTLFGETTPDQYGYTIPEVQRFTGDGTVGPFELTNFVGQDNPENAVVEVNGLRQPVSTYTINFNTNELTFDVGSEPANGVPVVVTSFNQTSRQYLNTQSGITGNTVSKIASINNNITPYTATTNCTATADATDYITCSTTSGFVAGQTVQFKGVTSFGGINISGLVYYIKTVVNGTTFTISTTPGGSTVNLSTGSGLVVAYVGGQPAVRITTTAAHNLTTNDVIRIDGTLGSVQLNNNTYYVHVISPTQVDLYTEAYNSGLTALNYPVTDISTYVSGGYMWVSTQFILTTADVTTTTTSPTLGNYLTVADTDMLVAGTPIVFSGTVFGGVVAGTTYYIREVIGATTFSITATRDGDEFVLTNGSGSMGVAQWEQDNVDRLWVTVNGYRVPSSALRLNSGNEVSILTEIATGDVVIIESMMPSATPNEEVYLLNVNQAQDAVVYRANTQTRTRLTEPLSNVDNTIYVNDVTRLTDTVIQNVVTPAAVDGIYSIGLTADKRIISSVTVYNNTTGQTISSSNYEVVIEALAPILKITAGAYISAGNSLTITVLEGNLIYVSGEQIKFTQVDLANNTLSGLQRGANGTGVQVYIPVYAELFGLLSNNMMTSVQYGETWNSNIYNPTDGDPLQISETAAATFLRGDVN